VVEDADTSKPKTPAPIVIDRFQFKQDDAGYLGKLRRHLYLLDVESGKTTLLTPGDYDELLPAWSPDGRSLAFVSKRRPDADRDNNWDLYVIEAVVGAAPRQLTTFEGPDDDPDAESRPAWSPDGRSIAYLQGGLPKLIYYAVQRLAVVPASGGAPRILTASLDRNVASPAWSADGSSIVFLLEDDRAVALARCRRRAA
jgi:Tol biopolymer transport system component